MSVYTSISEQDLHFLSKQFPLGKIFSVVGIQEGIENSNYFLSSQEGEFVLTVFESLAIDELPFCMQLMAYLSQQGIPCAVPLAAYSGRNVVELHGKPISVVGRLDGHSVTEVTHSHIEALGSALGVWHRTTQTTGANTGFGQSRANRYGKKWCRHIAAHLISALAEDEQQLLQTEMSLQQLYQHRDLPQGVIHSDLFRDNALFVATRLSGIIDLYDACTGSLLYDLGVVANDWCRDHLGGINSSLLQQLLLSYHAQRPLTSNERGAWPILMRGAALRFWLSRLELEIYPKVANLQPKKAAVVYKNILRNCTLDEAMLTEIWV